MEKSSYRWLISRTVVIAVAVAPLFIEMSGTSATLRHGGDWLGWLGTGMLTSSLLLMVREPLVVRWFGGLQPMYRWHHAFGVLACAVLVAHPLILASALISTNSTRAWALVSPARWFPANALGWAALLGLIVGLVFAMSRRIRYVTWRRAHLALGVAVFMGFAHAFAYRGITTSLMLSLVPSVFALGWRVLRADRGLGARAYEVSSVARIAAATTEIVLKPVSAPLNVAPGQFIMVAFFEGPLFRGCGEFHPYTVCGSRADGSLVLAIKALGDCTSNIQSVEQGVAARVQGPYGRSLSDGDAPSLWIAGGIGVTPFVARLRAGDVKAATDLIYAYRNPDTAAYVAELQEHASRQPQFVVRTVIAQDDPRPVFALIGDVQGLRCRDVHIAGPKSFIRAVAEELHTRGVPRSHIHSEEFEFGR